MMHPIGEETAADLAKPPEERTIKVGSKVTLSAMELMLLLDEFADRFMDAIGKTADSDGDCHPEQVDAMDLARQMSCEKVREHWKRDWELEKKAKAGDLAAWMDILGRHRAFLEKESHDAGDLEEWYIASVVETDPPVWTREHLEELVQDYWLIAKPMAERGCEKKEVQA